uniref:Uncharacterized protein n=1 Tax=Arion vulgaris TaxID=1028688 RepID=A0A0B6ZK19_9EUPU
MIMKDMTKCITSSSNEEVNKHALQSPSRYSYGRQHKLVTNGACQIRHRSSDKSANTGIQT